MQRTECQINTLHTDWTPDCGTDDQPAVVVSVNDRHDVFTDSLQATFQEDELSADSVGVMYRYQTPTENDPGDGVIGIANDTTGEFLLEGHVPPGDITSLVETGRKYAHTTQNAPFELLFMCTDGEQYSVQQEVLLVFSHDDELLRGNSLIPNNITL